MRIWDVHPGYLNRQSLLGEHRELHAVVSVLSNNQRGYSAHPETVRWKNYGWALKQRHQLVVTEMALRGYADITPVKVRSNKGQWPREYVDSPADQFAILGDKYIDREPGRIPLPRNAQQLWAQHKYSVLARDTTLYKSFGRRVSKIKRDLTYEALCSELVEVLRMPVSESTAYNAVEHMWGYVNSYNDSDHSHIKQWTARRLLKEVQRLALRHNQEYLVHSTALSDIEAWLR